MVLPLHSTTFHHPCSMYRRSWNAWALPHLALSPYVGERSPPAVQEEQYHLHKQAVQRTEKYMIGWIPMRGWVQRWSHLRGQQARHLQLARWGTGGGMRHASERRGLHHLQSRGVCPVYLHPTGMPELKHKPRGGCGKVPSTTL
jgi:hypothetical protein